MRLNLNHKNSSMHQISNIIPGSLLLCSFAFLVNYACVNYSKLYNMVIEMSEISKLTKVAHYLMLLIELWECMWSLTEVRTKLDQQ